MPPASLCDFLSRGGHRVHLVAFPSAPLVNLRAGRRDDRVTLDVGQAAVLRDALTTFIDTALVRAEVAGAGGEG